MFYWIVRRQAERVAVLKEPFVDKPRLLNSLNKHVFMWKWTIYFYFFRAKSDSSRSGWWGWSAHHRHMFVFSSVFFEVLTVLILANPYDFLNIPWFSKEAVIVKAISKAKATFAWNGDRKVWDSFSFIEIFLSHEINESQSSENYFIISFSAARPSVMGAHYFNASFE